MAALVLAICGLPMQAQAQVQVQVQRSFINPGFEEPFLRAEQCRVYASASVVPGWSTNHPDDNAEDAGCGLSLAALGTRGPLIELWRTVTARQQVKAPEGVQLAELNAKVASRLFQNICLVNGESVQWRFSHRGRAKPDGYDVARMVVGANSTIVEVGTTNNGTARVPLPANVQSSKVGDGTWVQYSGGYVYQGATGGTNIGFEAVSSAGGSANEGNFLDNVQISLTPFVDFPRASSSDLEGNNPAATLLANRPTLRVNGFVPNSMTVNIRIKGGTAVLGVDYFTMEPTGTGNVIAVTVPAGTYDGASAASLIPLPVYVKGNSEVNPNKTIEFSIEPDAQAAYKVGSSTVCGAPGQADWVYTIIDDDGPLSITKTAGEPVPVSGSSTQFDVPFTITVRNDTPLAKSYVLKDAPEFDANVRINALQSLTCSRSGGPACDGAVPSAPVQGSGPPGGWTLNSGSSLPANAYDTYRITLRITVNPGSQSTSVCGSQSGNGLFNRAELTVGDEKLNAHACSNTPKLVWVQLKKDILERVNANDNFSINILSGGLALANGSATTMGSGTHAETGRLVVPAGTTLQFSETLSEGASGANTWAGRYRSGISCTGPTSVVANAYKDSSTGTGNAARQTRQWPDFLPGAGDDLVCTITNEVLRNPRITASKSVSAKPLLVGAASQFYTIAVTVADAATTAPLSIADRLPDGITLAGPLTVSGSNNPSLSGCAASGSELGASCQLPAGLAVGTYTITIPIQVSADAMANGATNTAYLNGGGDAACTGANACAPSTGTVDVKSSVNLTLVKKAEPVQTYLEGQPLNYTIVVRNSGPSTATGVRVSDAVPDSVDVTAWQCTPSAGASCGTSSSGRGNQVNLSNVSLPKDASITLAITGLVKPGTKGEITNSATVTPDPTAICASASCEKTDTVTNTNAGEPRLAITKAATPTAFVVGQAGTYSIQVSNTGTRSSESITVKDTMPQDITITGVSGTGWTCTRGSNALECTRGPLVPGANAPVLTVHVNVGPDAISPSTNTANLSSPGSNCTVDNPCKGDVTTVINAPHIDVSKSLTSPFVVGQESSYVIRAVNNGRANTLGGAITDVVPEGLVLGVLPEKCTANGQQVSCELPSGLQPGQSASFTIKVTPLASLNGKAVVNSVKVEGITGDPSCPDAEHCTASTNDTVTAPQLLLQKTASAESFIVNTPATYTLLVRNTGTSATTASATVTDSIPAQLAIDTGKLPEQCTMAPEGSNTVECSVPAGLAVGASLSFDIVVTPSNDLNGLSVTNRASVAGGGDPGCEAGVSSAKLPQRCTSSVTTPVNAPKLKLEKTASAGSFQLNVAASYTLKVTNVGAADTSGNITITDVIPGNLRIGRVPAECSAEEQALTCTTSQVLASPSDAGTAGGSVDFVIEVTPTMASGGHPVIRNTATVLGGGDPVCPQAEHCTSTVEVPLEAPHLQLLKKANGPWTIGQAGAEYALEVTNTSANVKTFGAITVKDVMPNGITPQWEGTQRIGNWDCTRNEQKLSCVSVDGFEIVGNGGDTIVIPVTVSASAVATGTSATVTNHASVGGGGDPFHDGNTPEPGLQCTPLDEQAPGHCASTGTDVRTESSLAVQKNNPVIAPGAAPGQFVATYEVLVTNSGGVSGTYTLLDQPGFPQAGVTLLGWTVNALQGGRANDQLAVVPGNGVSSQISASNVVIQPGEPAHRYEVAMTFSVSAGTHALACNGTAGNGAFNTARITGGSVASDSGCTALPGVPNLSLTKSANGPWSVGQSGALYTLTVKNTGSVATTGLITVLEQMPQGVTLESVQAGADGWACVPEQALLRCTSSVTLQAGGSSSFLLEVKVGDTAGESLINRASVGGGGDPFNSGTPPQPDASICLAGDVHCASVTTPLQPNQAVGDPIITKDNHTPFVLEGETTTYTVTLTNPSEIDATDVSWTDKVVSGLSNVVIKPDTATPGSVLGQCTGLTCTGITVAAHGTLTYLVTARVTGVSGTLAVNTAAVTGGNCPGSEGCTAEDTDDILRQDDTGGEIPGPGPDVKSVPVDSRFMLALLGLLLVAAMAVMQKRTGHRSRR